LERTLVILKPNAVQRELVGELFSRFERRGLKISALKMVMIDNDTAAKHYEEHRGKSFYDELVSFIVSGPSILMVLESPGAVALVRMMVGSTDPADATSGTIRGDYATIPEHNMIHASDSTTSAEREISIFFEDSEILEYRLSVRPWL